MPGLKNVRNHIPGLYSCFWTENLMVITSPPGMMQILIKKKNFDIFDFFSNSLKIHGGQTNKARRMGPTSLNSIFSRLQLTSINFW